MRKPDEIKTLLNVMPQIKLWEIFCKILKVIFFQVQAGKGAVYSFPHSQSSSNPQSSNVFVIKGENLANPKAARITMELFLFGAANAVNFLSLCIRCGGRIKEHPGFVHWIFRAWSQGIIFLYRISGSASRRTPIQPRGVFVFVGAQVEKTHNTSSLGSGGKPFEVRP